MIWPGLGRVDTLPLLVSQIAAVSKHPNDVIRNIGLAKLIHNATLTYAKISEEERPSYRAAMNNARMALDNFALKAYFSKKEDHLIKARLKGSQALEEHFYINVRDPLDDNTIIALLELKPFLEDPFVRAEGEPSLGDDVLVTILYSYAGKGEEKKLIEMLEMLKGRIRDGFWCVLLDAYKDPNFKPLSVQTMIQVEAYVPHDISRIGNFVRIMSEEDIFIAYEYLMISHLERKDMFLKEIKKINIFLKKIL